MSDPPRLFVFACLPVGWDIRMRLFTYPSETSLATNSNTSTGTYWCAFKPTAPRSLFNCLSWIPRCSRFVSSVTQQQEELSTIPPPILIDSPWPFFIYMFGLVRASKSHCPMMRSIPSVLLKLYSARNAPPPPAHEANGRLPVVTMVWFIKEDSEGSRKVPTGSWYP